VAEISKPFPSFSFPGSTGANESMVGREYLDQYDITVRLIRF